MVWCWSFVRGSQGRLETGNDVVNSRSLSNAQAIVEASTNFTFPVIGAQEIPSVFFGNRVWSAEVYGDRGVVL